MIAVYLLLFIVAGFVLGYEMARRRYEHPQVPQAQARVDWNIGPVSEKR